MGCWFCRLAEGLLSVRSKGKNPHSGPDSLLIYTSAAQTMWPCESLTYTAGHVVIIRICSSYRVPCNKGNTLCGLSCLLTSTLKPENPSRSPHLPPELLSCLPPLPWLWGVLSTHIAWNSSPVTLSMFPFDPLPSLDPTKVINDFLLANAKGYLSIFILHGSLLPSAPSIASSLSTPFPTWTSLIVFSSFFSHQTGPSLL